MREHLARAATARAEPLLPEGKEAVFDYFTGEIFGRARAENQRVLMLAALLPSVSRQRRRRRSPATPEAPLVLDYVYRRHLFTDRRRIGGEPVYQFHALFREFLLAEGTPPAARRRNGTRRSTAPRGQLVARGDFDAAAALYIEAQAWPALVGLTLHAGRSLLAEGRAQGARRAGWPRCPPKCARPSRGWRWARRTRCMHAEPARAKALLDARVRGLHRARRRAPRS